MQTKKKPARARDKQHKEDIILAIILALCLIVVIFISSLHYRTPDTTTSYIVKPGDTLWEIAEKYCPNHHTGNTVFKIERLNHIDGYIAEDCGPDIKGNRLDIFMVDRGQALDWGRQTVKVVVVE